MTRNPYQVLGLGRSATSDEVKRAWNGARAALHPDRGGSTEAFQRARAAFELLRDPVERASYDLLHPAVPGSDVSGDICVPLAVAVVGGAVSVGERLVKVPPGVFEGDTLRVRGAGDPGDPPGDLLLAVELVEHGPLAREGRDLLVQVPVTWLEALRGAVLTVPAPDGAWEEAVAAGSVDGDRFRLRGRGLGSGPMRGDLVGVVRLVAPPADPLLVELLQLLQTDAGPAARRRLAEELRKSCAIHT